VNSTRTSRDPSDGVPMRKTIVILVVGLTPGHLGPKTPRLSALARAGGMRPLATVTPAVTCTVQATFMTGSLPRDHGIVANGWLFRDLLEVWLWRQSALHVRRTRTPTLTLVYLPHLDYDLQRLGPDNPLTARSLEEIDAVAGTLIADAEREGARVIVLSEYGLTAVSMPIHVNRALRQAGLLAVRTEDGGEVLDIPQSRAFALADHQIAHLYISEPTLIEEVRRIVAALPGVDGVFDRREQHGLGIDHARSG